MKWVQGVIGLRLGLLHRSSRSASEMSLMSCQTCSARSQWAPVVPVCAVLRDNRDVGELCGTGKRCDTKTTDGLSPTRPGLELSPSLTILKCQGRSEILTCVKVLLVANAHPLQVDLGIGFLCTLQGFSFVSCLPFPHNPLVGSRPILSGWA